ncbi:hypothetical protein D3C84_1083770 [compost metagenome]
MHFAFRLLLAFRLNIGIGAYEPEIETCAPHVPDLAGQLKYRRVLRQDTAITLVDREDGCVRCERSINACSFCCVPNSWVPELPSIGHKIAGQLHDWFRGFRSVVRYHRHLLIPLP